MSPDEKALYDDVTSWILQPDLCAFRGSQRHLLLIGFHRRMASSLSALSVSLAKIADRLRKKLESKSTVLDEPVDDKEAALELARDMEEDPSDIDLEGEGSAPEEKPPTHERLRA